MCCNTRLTVCSRSSAAGRFQRLRLLDWDIGTIEAEFACDRDRVWCECDKGVDAGIVGKCVYSIRYSIFVFYDVVRLNADNAGGSDRSN